MEQIQLRERIMRDLTQIYEKNGCVSREELSNYAIDGIPYRLVDQSRGIWNPKYLDSTLSIISDPDSHYKDHHRDDGLIEYAYQKGNLSGVNTKMRIAMKNRDPIILLTKIATGVFVPVMPVYIVGDDPLTNRFLVAIDEAMVVLAENSGSISTIQKKYAKAIVKRRLHQPEFRGRVMRAYNTQCAICLLRHGELLDAAHIMPDMHELGVPAVSNGIALCKIHHTAYDQNFVGISPDLIVHVNNYLLEERDGPMLKHGIQEMSGRKIYVPEKLTDNPSIDALDYRFKVFNKLNSS
jgi:putative restriction endonuclease